MYPSILRVAVYPCILTVIMVGAVAADAVGPAGRTERASPGGLRTAMPELSAVCAEIRAQRADPALSSKSISTLKSLCAHGPGPTAERKYTCTVGDSTATGECTDSVWENIYSGMGYCSAAASICLQLGGKFS